MQMADMPGMEPMAGMPHMAPAALATDEPHLPAEVSFPYAFPRSGSYRLVVQVKEAGAVRTAIFDALVVE